MVQRLLCELAGVDPNEAEAHRSLRRYASLGILVVATTTLALFATTFTMHATVGLKLYEAILLAIVVATMVFAIDRLIVSAVLASDGFVARLKMLAVRGLVSLALGLFIAHGVVTFMLHDALLARASENATKTANHNAALARSQAPETADAAAAQKRIDTLTRQNMQMEKTATALQTKYYRNTVCVPGSNRAADGDYCGTGGVSPSLKAAYDNYVRDTLTPTTLANSNEIARLRTRIVEDNSAVAAIVSPLKAADSKNIGLAAQTHALRQLLAEDPFLWLIPIFFIILDMGAALQKATLPASGIDRAERRNLRLEAESDRLTVNDPSMAAAYARMIANEAELLIARSDANKARELARIAGAAARPQRRLGPGIPTRTTPRVLIAGGLGVLILALVVSGLQLTHKKHSARATAHAAAGAGTAGDTVVALGRTASLVIPRGAISGNAPVTARPVRGTQWKGHTPVTSAYEISTSGSVVGQPVISLRVPKAMRTAAANGDVMVAFQTPTGWQQVPATFDLGSSTLRAKISHFSTWKFWEWDWANILAHISQTTGELVGQRHEGAKCTSGVGTPAWFNTSAGVSNDPALVVRSCIQGHPGDDVLDVQIVNNRPYGLFLDYEGAGIKWGWHESPVKPEDAVRDAIGDAAAARDGGLYLPPLSRASVGIVSPGNGKYRQFPIFPTVSTLAGDVADLLIGKAVDGLISSVVGHQFTDAFKATQGGECAKSGYHGVMDTLSGGKSAVIHWVTSNVASCLKSVITVMARQNIADGAIDLKALTGMSDTITKLKAANTVAEVEPVLESIASLVLDGYVAQAGDLAFGFSILSHYHYVAPTSTPSTNGPSTTTPWSSPTPSPTTGPNTSPTTPASPSTPAITKPTQGGSVGFTIEDSIYGGTWARNDPNDGTWYAHSQQPSNSPYWYPNGLGVAVDCARQAASYRTVVNGVHQTWSWWAHITDGEWVPIVVFSTVWSDGSQGLPSC